MKKKIPYAIANLEEIRRENYYFIDKTRFIEELENYKVPVFLRPRRFGKTLWCSVLECYYDINKKADFSSLFGDLYIGKNPTGLENRFLVLRLNFSVVEVKQDIAVLEENFKKVLFLKIKTFLTYYKGYFKGKIKPRIENPPSYTLESIIDFIKENNLPPLYLIIDEYDNFTNQLIISHNDSLYYHLTGQTKEQGGDSFFRAFFKVIKAGVEIRAIGKVFITGVLPITIDDLTSGFNITEIVTLKKHLHNMLGFTQEEVDFYLESVFEAYGLDKKRIHEIRELLITYYNGYLFLSDIETKLYNSTILTYFLKSFVMAKGEIPRDMIDTNLRTDISWIRRLTGKEEQTYDLIEKLMIDGILPYDTNELEAKFNMKRFFDPGFYSSSLFYLGMLTRQDNFLMVFPNQTVKQIFAGYYYDLLKITGVDKYITYFRQFLADCDLSKVFAGYWETYIIQIPAQAFDKMNENFFRLTFFELCSRYLSDKFTFGIEVNYPSGRSGWEMLGKPGSDFDKQKYLIEFKYFTNTEAEKQKILNMTGPEQAELDQIAGYERDILAQFPGYEITKGIIYIAGNKGFRFFSV